MLSSQKKPATLIKEQRQTYAVLLFLFICRLLSMYFIPLNDTTEARYAEIARKMLETNNWVTPMHDYGVPFWAKPPLSTWLSAFSMKLFGVNELAVRLPSLLLSLGTLWLVWQLAKKHSGSLTARTATLVLASSFFFILNAGTVMTDPSLLFCTTLIMTAFWQALIYKHKTWAYLFFIGLGLGLLAKGPIALVLTGMPIFFWVLIQRKWQALWQNLPWFSGILLMLAIALPWYLLAESRTPGFLNYFIIGEHFSRFLEPGWQGDKYGFAHSSPYGMIWVFMFAGILPWTIPAIVWLTRHLKQVPALCKDETLWLSYLLLNMLVPLIFFTFAKNIIYPYVFPCLPAFALLFAEISHRYGLSESLKKRYLVVACIPGFIFLAAIVLFVAKPQWVAKSQKSLITAWLNQHPAAGSHLIYWGDKNLFSAQFYSAGKAKATLDAASLCQLLSNHLNNYLVLETPNHSSIPANIHTHLTKVDTYQVLKKSYTLYRSDSFTCQEP